MTPVCKIKPWFFIWNGLRIGLLNQFDCAIEITYATLANRCTVSLKCFLFMFLIGSQSMVVSAKFLSFVVLPDSVITVYT